MARPRRPAYAYDPVDVTSGAAAGLSGLAYLEAYRDGRVPIASMQATLAYDLVEVTEGRTRFRGRTADWLGNPLGSMHGGFTGSMLDSAMGCAVHSTLTSAETYTTLEYKVNFTRALLADTGEVFADASVIHRGGRIATAEGRITDATGRLYAHATSICLILKRED
ncbi:MAG: PaaI family thioesterase [Alphaproteobacteria bacterium]|nr:PaaI family thioesterase [Alphaproteobacteria bacterium]